MKGVFRFKQFAIEHGGCGQKVGTDSVLLGSWLEVAPDTGRVLDMGAGCGLLSLMVAQRAPGATIDAIEIDLPAAEVCRKNFEHSPWAERLACRQADITRWQPQCLYDLIVCNPPYHHEELRSSDPQRDVARHAGEFSVDEAIRLGALWLRPNGSLALVCPSAQRPQVELQAALAHFEGVRECNVVTAPGKEPSLTLFQLWRHGARRSETLQLRHSTGKYSDEYIELTKEYYLFLH